jgi:pre-mRNA-processing factor 6
MRFNANIATQEKRADVVAKCILSEPRHGEIWQSVAKEPKNAGKNLEEILKIVVGKLE